MRIFLDSSALAKRYVEEPGTERVVALCREAEEIILSTLCIPELVSGFNRLKREGKLSAPRYRALKRSLAADLEEATMVDLTPMIIDRAIACLEQAPLRAADAVHLACAMETMCDIFVTADQKQCGAAVRLKLKAESVVNSH